MIRVPRDFRPLLDQLSSATHHSDTARRLVLFFTAALLVIGDRTVSAVLRLLALIEPLNPSTYHRVFSHRRWSTRNLARIIAEFVINRFCPSGVIRLVGDETVDGHRGKKVYGKARHRDAVRSAHSHTVYRYGHKWIVLAILVNLPYTSRPIAMPVLVALYRDRKRGKKIRVGWYGGGLRNVEVITGVGHWFKSGKGLVAVRWVFVRDLDGTHRDEYFFTTHVSMSATAIIEMYGGKWNIETTFQELRAHLGLETTRGWHRNTVLRMAPCLFVLYTIVVTFYDTMPQSSPHLRERTWLGKEFITFSDMIISVRHYLWMNWVFEQVPEEAGVRKLPRPIRKLLDFGLTQAA